MNITSIFPPNPKLTKGHGTLSSSRLGTLGGWKLWGKEAGLWAVWKEALGGLFCPVQLCWKLLSKEGYCFPKGSEPCCWKEENMGCMGWEGGVCKEAGKDWLEKGEPGWGGSGAPLAPIMPGGSPDAPCASGGNWAGGLGWVGEGLNWFGMPLLLGIMFGGSTGDVGFTGRPPGGVALLVGIPVGGMTGDEGFTGRPPGGVVALAKGWWC